MLIFDYKMISYLLLIVCMWLNKHLIIMFHTVGKRGELMMDRFFFKRNDE